MPHNATPEGKVKEQVKAILKRYDVWYFMPVTGGYSQNGIPDFICCVPPTGQLLGIECKGTSAGHATALQQIQLLRIAAHGGATFLATPATLAELDVMIATIKTNRI